MTLEEIFEKYKGGIRIPRIQRGYVQGRDDEKGTEIRANFVPTLVDAVFNGKDLSLDFIYGIAGTDGDVRMPLVGQQRLTTLLLLSWLCGKWKREWHFTYESRRIPQLCVEGLMKHPYMATDKPSVGIENADWFLPVWKNDPTVSGMLRMLDAMYEKIGSRRCTDADFSRITFLLHGIDGDAETFDHIFRKMNARGKELSPWENLKAMLDKYLPDSLADEWRDKIDDEWAEAIWKHAGGDIAKLDKAMEKIVRIAYSRFAGPDSYDDPLYVFESKLSEQQSTDGVSVFDRKLFYQTACLYFSRIKAISHGWSKDRQKNALWCESSDGSDFWEWLFADSYCSFADRLRYAFLSELSVCPDRKRRRRVLLNLLDNTPQIAKEDLNASMEAGLEFLSGRFELEGLQSSGMAFVQWQLEDEKLKWKLPAVEVVSFEKDDLVHRGSMRFIGWSDFVDEEDVRRRLESVRSEIRNDWIGFYRNLAARIPEDAIGEREYVHVPVYKDDIATWRDKILSSRFFIAALASWHASPDIPEKIPYWVIHLCELLANGKAECSSLRKFGGWMFLLQNEKRRSPSGKSVRLDYNDQERTNRQLLKDGEIFYAAPWPWVEAKDGGTWFNVCHESWWMCNTPPRVPRSADGSFPEITNSMS